jgi:hypothetical protein
MKITDIKFAIKKLIEDNTLIIVAKPYRDFSDTIGIKTYVVLDGELLSEKCMEIGDNIVDYLKS